MRSSGHRKVPAAPHAFAQDGTAKIPNTVPTPVRTPPATRNPLPEGGGFPSSSALSESAAGEAAGTAGGWGVGRGGITSSARAEEQLAATAHATRRATHSLASPCLPGDLFMTTQTIAPELTLASGNLP
jgi:hypothetical protein